ncbi:MAG: DUF4920 domain-containing protein [Saprospiraceae bacterium]|nr:DUF4920 domain-containing protein [Bacteroidia bacterium]NNE14159.1 DUF4920 domain-containing protein [Saprospiraceae bacterium]NNL93526.1 DUF4920 domain-containing protein [Saprospiraceae bacterium]
MKILINLFLCSLFIFGACKEQQKTSTKGEKFGKEITADDAIEFDKLMEMVSTQDTVKAKVKANVASVCQVKGCWMNLVKDDKSEESIFVKFKDYGFFMPMDISGKEVIVEGIAYKEITTVEELKHYAEDEGKSKEEIEKITEPVEELKFMADGVIIL